METGRAPDGDTDSTLLSTLENYKARFIEAMDDDFNTAAALAVIFDLVRESNTLVNSEKALTQGTLSSISKLYHGLVEEALGLKLDTEKDSGMADLSRSLIELLMNVRQELRQSKEWEMADGIRTGLLQRGVLLEDQADGTSWRLSQEGSPSAKTDVE